MSVIFSDKQFSQKLERTEARANAEFVETRARLSPESGAKWIEVAGTYAMFDGVASPATQTFGLGMFDEVTARELTTLEDFFKERDAPIFHEVSPMADPSTMPMLNARGYQPIELTSVMYRSLEGAQEQTGPVNSRITTRIIAGNEAELWARTSAGGWATEMEGLAELMFEFGNVAARCTGSFPFLAELDGAAVSTGSLFIYGDVAMLAGASTIPEGRNNGAQSALLAARLKFASEKGCMLAIMGAAPGSQFQKNAQKNGFNIAYTRTKWQLVK